MLPLPIEALYFLGDLAPSNLVNSSLTLGFSGSSAEKSPSYSSSLMLSNKVTHLEIFLLDEAFLICSDGIVKLPKLVLHYDSLPMGFCYSPSVFKTS